MCATPARGAFSAVNMVGLSHIEGGSGEADKGLRGDDDGGERGNLVGGVLVISVKGCFEGV